MMTAAERILAIRRDIDRLIDKLDEIIDTANDMTYNLSNFSNNLFETYTELGYLVCEKCGGKGYTTYTAEDGLKMKQLCPECRGTGIEADFSKNLEDLVEELIKEND